MHLKQSHESACLDVSNVYCELRVHGRWRGAAHTEPCPPNSFTHLRHAISHILTCEVQWDMLRTCDRVHGLYYRVSDALNVIDCELPPHWVLTHLFRRTRYVFWWEICAIFQQDLLWWSSKESVYIFHCFIRHQVIFLCCVIVHMYLCTECLYWYETHELLLFMCCKVNIVQNANPYMKHQVVHDQSSLLMMFKCMRLTGCNAWKCHKWYGECVPAEQKNKLLTCLFNDSLLSLHGHNLSFLNCRSKQCLASVSVLPPHLCTVKTDITIQSVGPVVCLLALLTQTSFSLSCPIPLWCVRRIWKRTRISIP